MINQSPLVRSGAFETGSKPAVSGIRTTTARPYLLRLAKLAPYLVVALGYGLRLWHLTSVSVCCDEINSLSFATRPLGDLLASLATDEPHPPFYYAFLHGWLIAAGQSELALRFPSVLFSTLGLAAAFRAGRDVGGPIAGLGAAAVLATSQFSIQYAQDARMYAALQAWVALFLAGLVRYLGRPGRLSGAVVVVAGLLAAYTHYHGLLVVAIGAIPVLTSASRRVLLVALGPFVAIAILFAPWLAFARGIFLSYRGWMDVVSPLEILRRSAVAYSVGAGVAGLGEEYGPFFLICLALVGLVRLATRRQSRTLVTLVCLTALPLAAVMAAAATGRPLYHERYLIVITPAYAVLAGVGLAMLSQIPITALFGWGGLVALGILSLPAYYQSVAPRNPDFRASVALIEREAVQPAAVVMSPPQGPSVNFYLKDQLPSYTPPGTASSEEVASALAARLSGDREAWFVRYSTGDWDDKLGRWLESNAFYLRDRWITQNHIVTYALAPVGALSDRSIRVRVNGTFDLSSVRTGPNQLRPGDRALAGLRWGWSGRGVGGVSPTAKVSLRLIDPWGQSIASLDRPLTNPAELVEPSLEAAWQGALDLPVDAVPGPYHLEARFYDGATGLGWPVVESAGLQTDSLDLGQLIVRPTNQSLLDRNAPLDGSAIAVGPGLQVQRVQLTGGPYMPDSALVASFVWAAQADQSGSVVPEIAVRSAGGSIVASIQRAESDQPYRLAQLRRGERVRERLVLPLRGVSEAGLYDVVLRFGSAGAWVKLGQIPVEINPGRYARPATASERSDLFSGSMRLVGATVPERAVNDGSTFTVGLVWHAERLPTVPYTVFVHLTDATGKPVAQSDGVPAGGRRPTTGWIQGEYVVDEHQMTVSAAVPPGNYRLLAGLYEAGSGRRADVVSPLADGQAVVLGRVTVSQP